MLNARHTCSPMLSVTTQFSLACVSLRECSICILVHGEGILVSFNIPGILLSL